MSNYYLELNSSDIYHSSEHLVEMRKGQVALTEGYIKKIPEYMINYDDVLAVSRKKTVIKQ